MQGKRNLSPANAILYSIILKAAVPESNANRHSHKTLLEKLPLMILGLSSLF